LGYQLQPDRNVIETLHLEFVQIQEPFIEILKENLQDLFEQYKELEAILDIGKEMFLFAMQNYESFLALVQKPSLKHWNIMTTRLY
jgi:hypothetical protein